MDNGSGALVGKLSLMCYSPTHRSAEIDMSCSLRCCETAEAAPEALYLAARHVFEYLGCRRCEWRSDTVNRASARAALRLGFQAECIVSAAHDRQGTEPRHRVFSLLDIEWPARKAVLEAWLEPANFDAAGRQIVTLRGSGVNVPRARLSERSRVPIRFLRQGITDDRPLAPFLIGGVPLLRVSPGPDLGGPGAVRHQRGESRRDAFAGRARNCGKIARRALQRMASHAKASD